MDGVPGSGIGCVWDERTTKWNGAHIACNIDAVVTTLQRVGSDYAAAIIGRVLDSVLSADPRRVPYSYVLPEVSFIEAVELTYFGAKGIYPKT